jgi:hypothetical protein
VPAYRRWLGDPAMQGMALAVTIAVLIGASQFLFPAAQRIMVAVLPLEAILAIVQMQEQNRG